MLPAKCCASFARTIWAVDRHEKTSTRQRVPDHLHVSVPEAILDPTALVTCQAVGCKISFLPPAVTEAVSRREIQEHKGGLSSERGYCRALKPTLGIAEALKSHNGFLKLPGKHGIVLHLGTQRFKPLKVSRCPGDIRMCAMHG